MLIDTKQIITMTDLRENLSKFVALNGKGKSFVVSDRGELTSVLLPISFLKKQKTRSKRRFELLKEADQLVENLRKYKSKISSTDFIRKMRNSRCIS